MMGRSSSDDEDVSSQSSVSSSSPSPSDARTQSGSTDSSLSDRSFAHRLKLLQQGRGPRRTTDSMRTQENSSVDKPRPPKRRKASAPAELSTRVPVSRKRIVVAVPKTREVRDPRFDAPVGGVDPSLFAKEYGFVDEARDKELEELHALLRETKDQDAREAIVSQIHMLRQQDRVLQQKKQSHELSVRVKAKKRALNQEAGRNLRLSKSKVKKIQTEERYAMLKETGGVDKYMANKRKRLQQRNKKTIPVAKKK